jgi:alkanesulfonate monooxygenase SsuD/methylene tetrahydromethanopterin reductase-like flavin-dependent oxidoreductase (luciferase family)
MRSSQEVDMARPEHGTPPRAHTDRTGLRSALWLPLFDGLADPALVARLAAEAEEAGWHGVFVWDQLDWRAPVQLVADPWITLAAIATATQHLRLGPMVTPLARRRPAKVARETATLDRLSGGRLTLGVGLGADRFAGELSKTGEQLDDRLRGQMLDEALEILTAAWSGAPVHHRGEHYTAEGIRFLPRPLQQPGVPVWVAGFPGKVKPLRRAARYDGFFPANLERPDQLAEVVATITELRQRSGAPYDFAVGLPLGTDPAPWAEAGATWWMPEFAPEAVSVDEVRGVLRDGPAAP